MEIPLFSTAPVNSFEEMITIVNALLRPDNETKYKKLGNLLALNLLNRDFHPELVLLLISRLNLYQFISQKSDFFDKTIVPMIEDDKDKPLWVKICAITVRVKTSLQYTIEMDK
jgi:hypothetical protein